ncbi:hypothetical protein NECHADRAFT_88763 [Paecilomyces variotii No. 5]|uniref:FAD-binding domain-containing protein n=1 Tax=Byssochlamys spectabilis (strain No. 5 / NBRC 109023) TaxID=1356009 RepID=V5HU64_BYSSN|nr:hypothetical protein NECHADRAFT_88763 [Paecilomyces variotii No. 5]
MATPSQTPFRIAIIGGGIGGLVAALSIYHHCQNDNVQIDVYEQAPQYKEIGAGVGMGPNAAKLLDKIGLFDKAYEIAGKRGEVWVSFRRYDTGEEVVTVPVTETGKITQLPMHRAEFLDLLVREVESTQAATLHTKKQCRRLDDDNARYGNMIVYRGLCPMSEVEDWWPLESYAAAWMAPGRHFLTYPISQNKTLNLIGFVTTKWEDVGDIKESWTLTADKSAIQKEFDEFEPTVRRLPSKKWVFAGGKVALLGDAAHSMLPHQGAGAGQAVEDGYILGRVLQDFFRTGSRDTKALENWLNLYQAVRLPRAEKVQQTSRQAGELYEMQAPELKGLSYEECLPIVKRLVENRMSWIWGEDLDQIYEKARENLSRPSAQL